MLTGPSSGGSRRAARRSPYGTLGRRGPRVAFRSAKGKAAARTNGPPRGGRPVLSRSERQLRRTERPTPPGDDLPRRLRPLGSPNTPSGPSRTAARLWPTANHRHTFHFGTGKNAGAGGMSSSVTAVAFGSFAGRNVPGGDESGLGP